jgi:hypothetical protein
MEMIELIKFITIALKFWTFGLHRAFGPWSRGARPPLGILARALAGQVEQNATEGRLNFSISAAGARSPRSLLRKPVQNSKRELFGVLGAS